MITKDDTKLTGRQAEFSLISKGLGKSYLTPQMVDWHKNETTSRVYVPIDGNKKGSMPRYFKDKIYTAKDKRKISESRCNRESEKARSIGDVFTYQHNINESKKSLLARSTVKDFKKTKL